MSAFNDAIGFSLQLEEGYVNDPVDLGGETNFGITVATFLTAQQKGIISQNIVSVSNITRQDAVTIYRNIYWDTNKLDKISNISEPLSIAVFDFVVNSGNNGIKILQRLLGVA